MTGYPIYRRSFMGGLGVLGVGAVAGETASANDLVSDGDDDTATDAGSVENELVVTYDRDVDLATVQAAAMRVIRAEDQRAHFGRVDEPLGLVKIILAESTTEEKRETIKDAIADHSSVENV